MFTHTRVPKIFSRICECVLPETLVIFPILSLVKTENNLKHVVKKRRSPRRQNWTAVGRPTYRFEACTPHQRSSSRRPLFCGFIQGKNVLRSKISTTVSRAYPSGRAALSTFQRRGFNSCWIGVHLSRNYNINNGQDFDKNNTTRIWTTISTADRLNNESYRHTVWDGADEWWTVKLHKLQ